MILFLLSLIACNPDYDKDGYKADIDCDDNEVTAYPGAQEICDGIDNDCDGLIDEDDALKAEVFYLDNDMDGFGNPEVSIKSCVAPYKYVSDNTDCDDSTHLINPDQDEYCDKDLVDEDCDGLVNDDDDFFIGGDIFYPDQDDDGFGDWQAPPTKFCEPRPGYVTNNLDCDDSNPDIGACDTGSI